MTLPLLEGVVPTSGWQPVRLATLTGLRWLAVAGQAAGVLFVAWGLGFPLPLVECLLLVAVSALFNLALVVRLGPSARASATVATVQLGYDLVQLGGLLALTGGLQNPFSLLLLAPVCVSATTLPQRSTLVLSGLAILIASVISFAHLPLPWHPHQSLMIDRIYVIGIWVSLVCGVAFISTYTHRVAHEARQLADALTATELALSRHEQLNALDGLAAAAAHELGTPLSTIALAAKEMRSEVSEGPLAEDLDLIIAQSARCRTILAKLRNLQSGGERDPFAAMPLSEVLAEVGKLSGPLGKVVDVEAEGDDAEPVVGRNAALLYGLGNIVDNAVQFARKRVEIVARWTRTRVVVTVSDDGPGFPEDLLTRLGEPYLTTRRGNVEDGTGEAGGLGLGVFISKTLLGRSGAELSFENAENGGARVRISWPRSAIERRAGTAVLEKGSLR